MDRKIAWKRSNLKFPLSFDTIFFDIDGVLIETTTSFHAADIAVAEYVVGTIHGLNWGQYEGKMLVTIEDIDTFKKAGGYNNDLDMCYLLTALFTARLREWRGTSLAMRSIQEWAELSHIANLQGHGGRKWIDGVAPIGALPDYDLLGEIYDEYYWGTAEMQRRFGHSPHYLTNAPGFVQNEKMLYSPDFPMRLHQAGIRHLGLITGREGPELNSALERMEIYCGEPWWEVVISADICAKPDPRALRMAINAVDTQGGLFIGDTADDHNLVRCYQAGMRGSEPTILIAMLVQSADVEIYRKRGVDLIVNSVEGILDFLPKKR